MKNILITLFVTWISIIGTLQAQTITNPKISIQGILREASGVAVENGEYDLVFRIYDDINASISDNLYEELHEGVTVENGVYSVHLGFETSMGYLPFDKVYYVGVQVGSTELKPRIELTHSPYSMSAVSVTCSGAVGDIKYSILDWDDFQLANGDCWVPMDGRDITGTALEQEFGWTNVPDGSGLFLRAQEWNEGNDPDRTVNSAIATIQDEEFKAHSHTGTTDNTTSTMPEGGGHSHRYTDFHDQDSDASYNDYVSIKNRAALNGGAGGDEEAGGDDNLLPRKEATKNTLSTNGNGKHTHTMNPHNHTFTTEQSGGSETRPKNMNFYIYIRVN